MKTIVVLFLITAVLFTGCTPAANPATAVESSSAQNAQTEPTHTAEILAADTPTAAAQTAALSSLQYPPVV